MESFANSAGDKQRLYRACDALGLALDEATAQRLLAYISQMQRWNRTYNLTALRDPDQMLIQHLFDSLAPLPAVDAVLQAHPSRSARVFDVGSGGGLPGVVWAVMRPFWEVTCIDAVAKKTAFVRQMTGALPAPNLRATHARIETLDPAQCDVVVSRAFASLIDFANLAGRHVGNDGTLLAMKGKVPEEEIAALQSGTPWQVTKIEPLSVPELDAQRCLIWMRRSQGTL